MSAQPLTLWVSAPIFRTIGIMSDFEHEYLGEVKERKPGVMYALAFLLSPGIAHVYVGKLYRGIFINLSMVLLIEAFIITFSLLKFFPLLPGMVLGLAWVTITWFTTQSARKSIKPRPYVLKTYNHPLIYGLIAMLTFFGPLLATLQFTANFLITTMPIEHSALSPSVGPGDVVLVDRTSFKKRSPRRGELVALSPESGRPNALRVVAVAEDIIQMDGTHPIVNETPLMQHELQPAGEEQDMLAMVEENFGNRYVVSVAPRAYTAHSLPPSEIKHGSVFVLADNRNQIPLSPSEQPPRDSRNFGPILHADLVGKPMFIAWSRDQKTGSIRWERVGLRLR